MITYIDLIEKMKDYFPKWMDIRRKAKTSTGGSYLYAIAEEAVGVEEAIKEYKKTFFLDNYLDKEEEIIDFIYRANVGEVPLDKIKVTGYKVTNRQSDFYDAEETAYYNDGFIYLKQNIESVEIAIYEHTSIYSLEKQHVWNVYDEFATFLGLKRYQDEPNKELLNRILAYSNGKADSTESGIKHAIISDLVNIDNDLSFDDIKIERQTASNLIKYYDNFEMILDKLSSVNKDTFKEKKWDVDLWKIDINKINYIPHAWDIALATYANGVGYKDDLNVQMVDNKKETDITLSFYKKKLEVVNAYIQNNSIKEKINLTLKKYDSDIIPDDVKYRITAGAAEKIGSRNINIEAIEKRIGRFSIPIKDIADPFLFGVEEEDMAIVDSAFNYKIDLIPIDPLKEFFIESLSISNNSTDTDLINYGQHGFENYNGGIRNTNTKAYIQDKYMFSSLVNIDKEVDGFVISNMREYGEATIMAGKYKNNKLYFSHNCEKADVLLKDIKMTNCYMKNGSIVADTVSGEKSIKIELLANEIDFMISGNFTIQYEVDSEGINTITKNQNDYNFHMGGYRERKKLKVKIIFNEQGEKNFIKKVKFTAFNISLSSKNGALIYESDYCIIPNNDKCIVKFKMEAFTGFSPCINWIYIGNKLTPEHGIYNIAVATSGKSRINAKVHNCRIALHKINKTTGSQISTIADFKPFVFYSSVSNSSQIELFLDDFDEIRSMEMNHGTIETISYSAEHLQYILKIEAGKKVSHVTISGKRNTTISVVNLHEVLSSKGYEDTAFDFYSARKIERILARNKTTFEVRELTITKSDVCKGYNVSIVKVNMLTEQNIVPVFIETGNNKASTTGLESNSNFDTISFVPRNSREYIAINESSIIFDLTKDIDIVNTFNGGYNQETSLMFYTVESLSDNYMVNFQSSGSFEMWKNTTLGIKKIGIQRKDINNANFNYSILSIDKEFELASAIELPNEIIIENKEKIDLKKYIITNDYDISYLNKYTDSLNRDSYIYSEMLYIDDLMFSKLRCSNIHEIESLYYKRGEEVISLASDIDYKLHKKEGIITWINSGVSDSTSTLSIVYNINIAKAINIDIEDIYKKIEYNVMAYEKSGEINIDKVSIDSGIDLKAFPLYMEADLTNIKCKSIGFDAVIKNGFLTLEKNAVNNTVAVKAGFYYMNGIEHYLFANEKFDEIEKIDNLYFYNVEKIDKQFVFKQPSTNFISNSAFKANSNGNIHVLNCNDKKIDGASVINGITACDSFNHWNASSSILSIVDGYNGVGMKYKSIMKEVTFCYLNISDFTNVGESYVISYHIKDKSKSFLGQEITMYSNGSIYNKQSTINLFKEAEESKIMSNIFSLEFTQDEHKYYLVLQGDDVIDDIIITKKEDYNIDMHVKNVTQFNLDVAENIYSSYSTRFFLADERSSEYIGTEMKDGSVINSSFVHWGYTTIKSFNSKREFQECGLENVELLSSSTKAAVTTAGSPGRLITKEIFLGNIKTINNLVIKINDVMNDNMKGFKTKVLVAANSNSDFKIIQTSLDNIITMDGKILSPYIKILVEMPSNKVINNIDVSVEYLSEGENNATDKVVLSGVYSTKIHDAQYTANFRITHLQISEMSKDMDNYIFYVRATKENTDLAVWTEWKNIELKSDLNSYKNIANSVVFEGYRFFQFKAVLKGADASINIQYLDLEVI